MERVVAVTVVVLASTHVCRTLPHADRSVTAADRSGAAADRDTSEERYGFLSTANISSPLIGSGYFTPAIYPRPHDLDPRFTLEPSADLQEWPRHRLRKPKLNHDKLLPKYGHKKHLVEIVPIRHKSKNKALAYILPKFNKKKLNNQNRISGIIVNGIPDGNDNDFVSEENSIDDSYEQGLSDFSDSSESASSEIDASSILKYRSTEQKHDNYGNNDFETGDKVNDIDTRGLVPDTPDSDYHVHYIIRKKHHEQVPTTTDEHHHSTHAVIYDPPSNPHHVHNELVSSPSFGIHAAASTGHVNHHVHKNIAEISELDNQGVHKMTAGSDKVNQLVNKLPLNVAISEHNDQLPMIIIEDGNVPIHQHATKIIGGNSENVYAHAHKITEPVHKKIEQSNENYDIFRPSHDEIFDYNANPHLNIHHPHHDAKHDDLHVVHDSGSGPLSIGEKLNTAHVTITDNENGIAEAVTHIHNEHLNPEVVYINDAINNNPNSNLDKEIKVFYHVDSPDLHLVHAEALGTQGASDFEEASENRFTSDSSSFSSKFGSEDNDNSNSIEPNVESHENASSLDNSLNDSSSSESVVYDNNEPINEGSVDSNDSNSSGATHDVHGHDLQVSTEDTASTQTEEHHDMIDKVNSTDASADETLTYDVVALCDKTDHKTKCGENCRRKSYKLTFLFNR